LKLKIFLILLFGFGCANAQNRNSEKNNIGWFAYNGTFTLTDKFALHTEYQWRRTDYVKNWQQGLLRVGLNYNFLPGAQLRVGYAWAETFPYGNYPINSFGKDFTEHRAYEMVTLNNTLSRLAITHRFMLEQRWVGRYTSPELDSEDRFVYSNRLRYMLRLQVPLQKEGFYVAAYDELFCGFGAEIGENIFDQNRVGILVGYSLSKNFKLEGGYLNQIVQLGREIDGKNVFQKNHGFIISGIFNFDLRKTEVASKS